MCNCGGQAVPAGAFRGDGSAAPAQLAGPAWGPGIRPSEDVDGMYGGWPQAPAVQPQPPDTPPAAPEE